MTARYYRSARGAYLGAFIGSAPDGGVEVHRRPPMPRATWNGSGWIEPAPARQLVPLGTLARASSPAAACPRFPPCWTRRRPQALLMGLREGIADDQQARALLTAAGLIPTRCCDDCGRPPPPAAGRNHNPDDQAARHRRRRARNLKAFREEREAWRDDIAELKAALKSSDATASSCARKSAAERGAESGPRLQVGGRQHHGGRRAGRLQGPAARAGEVAGRLVSRNALCLDHFRPFRDTSSRRCRQPSRPRGPPSGTAGVSPGHFRHPHQRQHPAPASAQSRPTPRRQRPPALAEANHGERVVRQPEDHVTAGPVSLTRRRGRAAGDRHPRGGFHGGGEVVWRRNVRPPKPEGGGPGRAPPLDSERAREWTTMRGPPILTRHPAPRRPGGAEVVRDSSPKPQSALGGSRYSWYPEAVPADCRHDRRSPRGCPHRGHARPRQPTPRAMRR